MITDDHVRNMSDPEKMKYLLKKLLDDMPKMKRVEVLETISRMARGVKPEDFLSTFQLDGEYNPEDHFQERKGTVVRPSITVRFEDGTSITIDINDPTRKQFVDPQPEEEKPVRSILPQEELDELNHG